MVNTPVALIIFNRPDTTEKAFDEIAKARPPKLFVIADGPRADNPEDIKKCAAVREIIERVNWECEVFKNYSDVNLGCGKRPATGISWVFEHVEEAIILEDDCVPHPTFFRFCEELLERFCDDERVMMIGGGTLQFGLNRALYSYYFSCIPSCWLGWATWRRAWQQYDMEMKLWPLVRGTTWLSDVLGDPRLVEQWRNIFDKAYAGAGKVDYWDYQWNFTCFVQNSLIVLPYTNLASNIGFHEDATHSRSINNIRANLPTTEMLFPLKHPPYMVRNKEADQLRLQIYQAERQQLGLYYRLRRQFSAVMPCPLRKLITHLRTKGHG